MIRAFLAVAAVHAVFAGEISGVVLDLRSGLPIAGATVSTFAGANRTQTDAEGRFTIQNLKVDSHVIEVQKSGFAKLAYGRSPVVILTPGASVSGVTVRLTPGASISGRIVDATGQPLDGMIAVETADPRFQVGFERTNGSLFHFKDLPEGVYKVSASVSEVGGRRFVTTYYPSHLDHETATLVSIGAGESKSNLTITAREVPHHAVSGRYAGERLPNTRYSVIAEKSTRALSSSYSALVAPDGTFKSVLPSGRHRLKVMRIPHSPERPTVVGFAEIDVTDGQLSNVIISSSPLRTVRARFRWHSGQNETAPAGNIALNPTEGLSVFQYTVPGPDGWHTFREVAPDRYTIFAGGLPKGLYVHSVATAGGDITERGLDLITGSATEFEVRVGNDGGSLRGRLTDKANRPIPWTRISLSRATSHRAESELHGRYAATNVAGFFAFEDVAPGEYNLFARADDQSIRKDSVRISPRTNTEVNLRVP